ncbi:MAG: NAD(+)/NADH kinase, partial [Synergistaceae bacterium]|nr:NAD(+)/NADH kinase [Synergistaceae bacterium]
VGSTAYALSAGGPIIHPEVRCASIVPICAHSLAPRPVLVPCEIVINIKLDLALDGAILSGDGRDGADLSSGDEVLVTSDPDARVDIIRMRGRPYTGVLRKKLKLS